MYSKRAAARNNPRSAVHIQYVSVTFRSIAPKIPEEEEEEQEEEVDPEEGINRAILRIRRRVS